MRKQRWNHLLLLLDYLTQGKDTGLNCLIWTSSWVESQSCEAEKAFWKVPFRSQKGVNANGQWTTYGPDSLEPYGLSQIDIGEDRVAYGYSGQLCFLESRFVKGDKAEISAAEVSIIEICKFNGGTVQVCINQAGTSEGGFLNFGKHEIDIVENSIAEIGMGKVGTIEIGMSEVGTGEVSIDEVGILKVGMVKVGTTQVSTTKIGITQVCIAEIGTSQINTRKVNTIQLGTSQVNTTQIRTINLFLEITKTLTTLAFIIILLFSPSIPMLNTLSQMFELSFVFHRYLPFLFCIVPQYKVFLVRLQEGGRL